MKVEITEVQKRFPGPLVDVLQASSNGPSRPAATLASAADANTST